MLLLGVLAGLTPAIAAGNIITTHAGSGSGAGDGGPATSALLEYPGDAIVAPSGDLYIADSFNNKVRMVDATGMITTVAGTGEAGSTGDGGPATSAQLNYPVGLAADGAGNLYIAERGGDRIRKVDPSGVITTVAGTGTAGYSGDDGPATSAQIYNPSGMAVESGGALVFADSGNNRVRRISTTGTITTIAGTGNFGQAGDGGPAVSAQLRTPEDVTFDAEGNLYIADRNNNRIRKVDSAGVITTVVGNTTAGYSGDGGPATSANLNDPSGVAIDSAGRLLISDDDNNRIRRVSLDGTITTVAGSGPSGFSGDGGAATSAGMTTTQVAADGSGNFYIADVFNHRIRKVDPSGIITTVAGAGSFGGDGGPAVDAYLRYPVGVTTDGAGNVYLTDYGNHRVRKVDTAGTITTVAGNGSATYAGDGGAATAASLSSPADVAVDGAGNLYIADMDNHAVRKVTPAGIISTVAGTGAFGYSGDGGPATSAQLFSPAGLDLDGSGNLYIADSDNNRIRRVSAAGIITTVAGTGVANYSGDGGLATSARLHTPVDVAVGPDGSLFIADYWNHRIRKVTGGVITTVAGNGFETYGGDGGAATSASLDNPAGVALDPVGNLFIADAGNNRIRQVDTSGIISTVAGTGVYGFSGDGGLALDANLAFPTRVALDGSGDFYLADTYNDRVRKVEALGSLPAPEMTGTDPASPANDNAPFVLGTAEAGTTVSIYTDENCTAPPVGSGTAEEFASPGIQVSVADDSTTSFYATATDSLSNVSACSRSPVVYVEDSTAPSAPTISDPPPSPSSDPAPSWSFTADAGATTECELSRGGSVVSTLASCSSPASYDLSGELDGDYTFTVRATDAAGNAGPAATDTYTLDRVAPAAPVVTDSPVSPGNDASPSWSFTAETGAATECELSRGDTVVSAYAACTSPSSFDLSAEPDGDYTFAVRATDGAGNTGTAATSSYTYDTSAPVVTVDAGPSSPGNDANPSWSFTAEAGATTECELSRGGTVVSAYAACTSPASFDLSAEPDGDYTFAVRATDGAGNTGTAATSGYTYDTTAPTATVAASPASPDSDPSPSWSFTAEPGATTRCQLSLGAAVISAYAACSSPATYDLSGEADGDYTFRVRATDAAGNIGTPDASTYTYDTTAPAPPSITGSPTSPGNDPTPSWSFTAEAGASTQCELSHGATVVSAYAACTSPATFDLSAEPDGDYTFKVRATDGAGNTGSDAQAMYLYDTTAPMGPTITSSPSSPDNATAVSWSFTAEADVTTECELARGATVIDPLGPCSSPASYDLSGEPDGTYTFAVLATDEAGNPSGSATSGYVLDTTAPDGPAIISSPSSPDNATAVSWSFSTEDGATTECELSRGGTVVSGWSSCSSPATYDLAGHPDGDYTFKVRATDGAGNTGGASSSTYTLDTTGPATSIDESPSSPGNDPFPSWSFSTGGAATSACQLARGATVVSPWAPCASPAVYDLSAEPDGDYTFRVRSTDPVGNVGPVASSGYTLDTTGPATSIDASPASPSNDPLPSWSFSTEPGAASECELSRGATVVSVGPCTSPAAYDLSAEPDGTYTFRVHSLDALGNTGPEESSAYELDRAPPAAPTITSAPASPDTDRGPAWSFDTEAGAITECELTRGATVISAWFACASPAAFDLTGEPDGDYTFRVRATDEAGNTGGEASDVYTLDTTGPTVVFTDTPASPGNSRTPTWSFTTEAGAITECELAAGTTVVSAAAPCFSPAAFDLTGQPDGDYTVTVVATDGLGNVGPSVDSTYTLDTSGPDTAITAGPVAVTSDRTPVWSFTTEDGATTECELSRAGSVLYAYAACGSPDGYDLTAEPDGDYTFRVRATDQAGNVGPADSASFTLDTSAPFVSITAVPASPATSTSPTWEFSGEPGATTDCRLTRGTAVISGYAACTSPATYDLSSRVDGDYTFHVRATDDAGNRGTASGTYTLDTTPPDPPTITSSPSSPGSSKTATWRFSAEPGSTTRCRLAGDGTAVEPIGTCSSPATYDLSGLPDGDYTFRVHAIDAVGNAGAPAASTYTLDTSSSKPPPPPPDGGNDGPGDGDGGQEGTFPPPIEDDSGSFPPPEYEEVVPEEIARDIVPSDRNGPLSPERARATGGSGADQTTADVSGGGDGSTASERPGKGRSSPPLWRRVAGVVAEVVTTTAFPLALLLAGAIFLVIQNRIDRRDPKLALAPVHPDPHLDFGPAPA